MSERQERTNKTVALLTSVVVHALLFLVFLFVMAWRAPNPPLPEYGFELNFGLDSQGSGEIQPVTPAGSDTPSENEEQQIKNDQPDEETKSVAEDKIQPDNSKTLEQPVTTRQESPVTVKEEKKEQQKPVEKPVEKPKEKTETTTEVKPKETENKSSTPTDKAAATEKEGKPVSQGDKTDKTGDQGDPKGTPDAKALYGNQGGGAGGTGLELAGWTWDYIPKPNVPNNETGRIVFEIKVNADGELEGYRVIERSVSPEAEKACREAIEKLTFTRKDGAIVPAISTGKITFVIRSN